MNEKIKDIKKADVVIDSWEIHSMVAKDNSNNVRDFYINMVMHGNNKRYKVMVDIYEIEEIDE